MLQEYESKQLRVERHSLKVGLDTSGMNIDRLENEVAALKQQLKNQGSLNNNGDSNNSSADSSVPSNTKLLLRLKEDELNRKTLEAKELASQMYDDKQTIAILEDRLRDLNFNLHQKNTELASIKTMAAVRSDGQDREVAELNDKV